MNTMVTRKERETKPRLDLATGAAVWTVTAVVNGTPRRGKLAVCRDGRICFGISGIKYRPGEVTPRGQRVLVGRTPLTGMYVEALVDEAVYQTLRGMIG